MMLTNRIRSSILLVGISLGMVHNPFYPANMAFSQHELPERKLAYIQRTRSDTNRDESASRIIIFFLDQELRPETEITMEWPREAEKSINPVFIRKEGTVIFYGDSTEEADPSKYFTYKTKPSSNILSKTGGITGTQKLAMEGISDLDRLSSSFKEMEIRCTEIAESGGYYSIKEPGAHIVHDLVDPQNSANHIIILRRAYSDEYHEFLSGLQKSYPVFFMMFTYNTLTDQVHHALGNDKDRLNIYNGGFSTDGRYAFFSIPNYLSESQDMEGGINLRVVSREAVAEEPAWNLRVMDLGTFKLDCLTTGGFRSQSYLTGRVDAPRWSPDNQRIAFVHSKESFFADRLHNECDGLYVYDLDKKTYWRPTDKWMQEQPIGWAPDSKRILLRKMRHFDFPPERETRPEGIYWVNVDTREEKQIGGPTSDARDTCWSPDGRHIFLLTRDEKSNSHILEIVRADDPTDRIEVKRIPIKEGDKMNFIRGLSWLDPNLKQSERTERYDIMEVSQ